MKKHNYYIMLVMFVAFYSVHADMYLLNTSDYTLNFKFGLTNEKAEEHTLKPNESFKIDQTKEILYQLTPKTVNNITSFILTPKTITSAYQLPCRLAIIRSGIGSTLISKYQQIDTASLQETINNTKEANKGNNLYLKITRSTLGTWLISPTWEEKKEKNVTPLISKI